MPSSSAIAIAPVALTHVVDAAQRQFDVDDALSGDFDREPVRAVLRAHVDGAHVGVLGSAHT